ncbi:segregation/condensation protein A [Streptococcus thoraltensis]|uniref:segregation/condensation protein A n=1 Tax=Streptococcus thoraltensis TaxID=55085 RepID=UPI00037A2319|nr:segregation/condensation protein A [Streptococcus thoraltensis]MDY4761168.1 segregation/condensation protein A [Streptococcus thoraltensis]
MDIKLKDFEGPLDLLLHLVSKYEVDIYDVPLVEVIEQYLAYLATLQAMKLEIAGEYMVMASQLMLIKSRKLLPKVVEETPLEEDLEMELLSQIEEYKRFKAISQELGRQHQERAKLFSKAKTEIVSEDVILKEDKTTLDLYLAFSKIMAQKQVAFNQEHTTIAADDYRIEDMMVFVESQLEVGRPKSMQQLFQEVESKEQMITIFLAILELVKRQVVRVEQEQNFSDVTLRREAA